MSDVDILDRLLAVPDSEVCAQAATTIIKLRAELLIQKAEIVTWLRGIVADVEIDEEGGVFGIIDSLAIRTICDDIAEQIETGDWVEELARFREDGVV